MQILNLSLDSRRRPGEGNAMCVNRQPTSDDRQPILPTLMSVHLKTINREQVKYNSPRCAALTAARTFSVIRNAVGGRWLVGI